MIDPANPIKAGKNVSAIRNRMVPYLDIQGIQKVLYDEWCLELKAKDMFLTDAKYYESLLHYPIDIKLLWECCEWL